MPVRTPERVWIQLPTSIDAVVALVNGLLAVWPDAAAVTDHGREGAWLCIELRGERVRSDAPDE